MFKQFKGGSYKVFNDSEIKEVHEASVYLLENVGIQVHNERAMQIFADNGAAVDKANKVVKIPRGMLEDAVDSAPSRVILCGREEKNDLVLEGTNVYLGTGGTALNTLDVDTGKKRPTTVEDVAGYAKMTDALDNVAFFLINCYAGDVSVEDEDVNRFFHSFKNTSKHVMGGIYTMDGLMNVIDMAEEIAGGKDKLKERPFVSFITLIMSPLKMENTYSDFLIEVAKRGLPVTTPAEPLAGATSPVTMAGTVTINNAESLAGVVLAQLVNKGTPTIYGSVASTINMQSGTYLAGCIESALINVGCSQMAQYYKVPIYGTGGMSDSKAVDCQAGYESANTAMLVALSGCNYIHDAFGVLEFCVTLSYEKMVTDNDSVGMALRAVEGVETNENTIAKDVIAEVGPGGHFLDHTHTFENVRKEFYIPSHADRQQRSVWEAEGAKDSYTRANEEAKRILKEHKPFGLSEDMEKQLRDKFKNIK